MVQDARYNVFCRTVDLWLLNCHYSGRRINLGHNVFVKFRIMQGCLLLCGNGEFEDCQGSIYSCMQIWQMYYLGMLLGRLVYALYPNRKHLNNYSVQPNIIYLCTRHIKVQRLTCCNSTNHPELSLEEHVGCQENGVYFDSFRDTRGSHL